MCTVQAVKKGVKAIAANKSAVLLLWLTNLFLALAVALPVYGWLGKMNHTAAADSLLEGFSLPLLVDLLQYDFSTVSRLMGTLVFWLVLCASLTGTFMSGGILTVLVKRGRKPFLERFFAGGGRYFPRFLRLLLGAGVCAGVVLIALNTGLGLLVARLSRDASELTPFVLLLCQVIVNILVGTIFLLAVHYARIQTVVDESRGMARVFLLSLVFVFRNILRVFALIIFFTALTGVVYLLYAVARSALPATTWLLIFVLMGVQQIVALARSAFQVGLYGAELELFLLRRPKLPERVPLPVLTVEGPAERTAPRVPTSQSENPGL